MQEWIEYTPGSPRETSAETGTENENKNGQNEQNFELSPFVTPGVQFSNHFMGDLRRLANLVST